MLIENNAKEEESKEFHEIYKKQSEWINELKTAKIKNVSVEKIQICSKSWRIDRTIARVFDQDLVKSLISSIRVNKSMRLEIQFYSVKVIKQDVNYYE